MTKHGFEVPVLVIWGRARGTCAATFRHSDTSEHVLGGYCVCSEVNRWIEYDVTFLNASFDKLRISMHLKKKIETTQKVSVSILSW